ARAAGVRFRALHEHREHPPQIPDGRLRRTVRLAEGDGRPGADGAAVESPAGERSAMRTILGLLPLCLLLAACATAGGPVKPGGNLASQLAPFFHRQEVNIAVAYRNLGTGAYYFRNEDDFFHAASTMKLPVMMALFQTVDAGERRLSEPIAVRNQF